MPVTTPSPQLPTHPLPLLPRLEQLDSAALAAWGTALITLLGILVAIFAVWWQIRKQRLMNSAAMITTLADRFTSEEWRAFRIHCAASIEANRCGSNLNLSRDFPILGFFENVGHLVRRGVLDKEMIWNKFGWYVTRYFIALTTGRDVIAAIRGAEGDPTLWEEFEWLNKKMLQIYKRRGIVIDSSDLLESRIRELLTQESNLLNLGPAEVSRIVLTESG